MIKPEKITLLVDTIDKYLAHAAGEPIPFALVLTDYAMIQCHSNIDSESAYDLLTDLIGEMAKEQGALQ